MTKFSMPNFNITTGPTSGTILTRNYPCFLQLMLMLMFFFQMHRVQLLLFVRGLLEERLPPTASVCFTYSKQTVPHLRLPFIRSQLHTLCGVYCKYTVQQHKMHRPLRKLILKDYWINMPLESPYKFQNRTIDMSLCVIARLHYSWGLLYCHLLISNQCHLGL